MLELLEQLFRRVRAYIQAERFNRNQIYAQSPEHITMQFDREAEDIIIDGLTESGLGFEVITEERSPLSIVSAPEYRIIVDPIDGSDNMVHGIQTVVVALAVLPIDAPIVPECVQWSLVGELFSGTVYQAQRGGGAFRNRRRCQVSNVKILQKCIAGMNFDSRDPQATQALLVEQPSLGKIRRSGSAAMDCVYVASGAYDAYIDVGNVLTGESFLASASIVLEAGGIVTDAQGKPLQPITSLTDGYSLVVAGTKELHQAVITRIHGKPRK